MTTDNKTSVADTMQPMLAKLAERPVFFDSPEAFREWLARHHGDRRGSRSGAAR